MPQKILVIFVIVCMFLMLSLFGLHTIADDPGLGWHLQSGIYILEHFQFPNPDPFLAQTHIDSAISMQWLADVLFAAVYQIGGWLSLYTLFFTLIALFIGLFCFCASMRLSGSLLLGLVWTMLSIPLMSMHFIIRPVIFQLLFLSLLLIYIYFCQRTMRLGAPIKKASFGALFLLFILWTNTHPSFVIGLFLLGLWLISSFCLQQSDNTSHEKNARALTIQSPHHQSTVALLSICLAVAASFCTPHGSQLHVAIFEYMRLDYTKLQQEWMPPQIGSSVFSMLSILSIVLLLLVALLQWKNARREIFAILSPIPFLIVSFSAIRYAPLFALTFLFSSSVISAYSLPRIFSFFRNTTSEIRSFERLAVSTCATLMLALIFFSSTQKQIPFFSGFYGPSQGRYPYAALEWLHKTDNKYTESLIVFNHPNWGGFITHMGYPHLKPTIDDRYYLFDREFIIAFHKLLGQPDEELLQRVKLFATDYVLLPRQSLFAQWLKRQHQRAIVYEDALAVIFATPQMHANGIDETIL